MATVKRCVQCGILKEDEEYRKYTYSRTNDTQGRYSRCRSCEATNTAYRRAVAWLSSPEAGYGRNDFSIDVDYATVNKMRNIVTRTEELYKVLEERGLRVPGKTEVVEVDTIGQLMDFYKVPDKVTVAVSTVQGTPLGVPDDLDYWLKSDAAKWNELGLSPEYLQETIYESLKAKYRPQVGVDKDTYLPVYDNTYKKVLNDILRKFDDFEEACNNSDEPASSTEETE
jgi:hypothetical protein